MIGTAYYWNSPERAAQNRVVGDLVSRIVFGKPDWLGGEYCTMAVHVDGSLVGGTVYHNFDMDAQTVELTSGSHSKMWLTRPVIRDMFNLPFNILGCQACVLRVSSKNETMLKIARTFGFQETILPRLFGRENDMHVFTMTDDMWRSHKVNRHG